jgi:hypothetical protein
MPQFRHFRVNTFPKRKFPFIKKKLWQAGHREKRLIKAITNHEQSQSKPIGMMSHPGI